MKLWKLLLPACALLGSCAPAGAVITRVYPLKDVIADADAISVARVTTVDRKKRQVQLKRVKALKGNPGWSSTRLVLAGSDTRAQIPAAQARLTPGRTVVLFSKSGRFALGYADGMWLRMTPHPKAAHAWQFVHLEPYLKRTFQGRSAELEQVVSGVLAGKQEAPAPQVSAKPGYAVP